MSLQERFRKALEQRGYVAVDGGSRKYLVLEHPDSDARVFLGKAGAVRVGRTVSESRPLASSLRIRLLKEAGTS